MGKLPKFPQPTSAFLSGKTNAFGPLKSLHSQYRLSEFSRIGEIPTNDLAADVGCENFGSFKIIIANCPMISDVYK
jgi:hypothetical protein